MKTDFANICIQPDYEDLGVLTAEVNEPVAMEDMCQH